MPAKAATRSKQLSRAQELALMVNAALGTKDKPANVVKMGSDPYLKVTYLETGVLPFDMLGGLPRGRMVEVFGDFSTLKSYVGLCAIAQCQKEGGVAALIDTEGAFDPDWAIELGVNVNDLIIWPERNDNEVHTGEEAMDVAQTLIMGKLDLLVFDSVAAAAPKDVMSKRLHGESIQPARLAALMSEALRRLTTVNGKTAIMFINQTRINVGVTFGSNEALPGGKALPFYASHRIRLKKTGKITTPKKHWDGTAWIDGKKVIGQKFSITWEKSKLSAPHIEYHFVWDTIAGKVDDIGFLIAQGLEHGFVTMKGNTWEAVVPGTQCRAVGREKFRLAVETTPGVQEGLRTALKAATTKKEPSASPGPKTPRRRTVARRK